MIPFIDIKRRENSFNNEWLKSVEDISKKSEFLETEDVYKLEENLCKFINVKYAVTCANGTDALQLALRGCNIGKGDEVIIQNNTFWATCEAVFNVGATPIIVDIETENASMDIDLLERSVKLYKPQAIIIAHIYGWSNKKLYKVREISKKLKIPLIEDGAQSFGTIYLEESIYKNAYISTTSFYPSKVLGAAGNGGCVFTNNLKLSERIRKLANHGRSDRYYHDEIGWNSRMDSLQAAYLNISLKYISERIESRKKIQDFYFNKLDVPQLYSPDNFIDNAYCHISLFKNKKIRAMIIDDLIRERIGYSIIYPKPISSQIALKKFNIKTILNKNTENLCNRILNLPLFPYLTPREVDKIVSVVNKSFRKIKN